MTDYKQTDSRWKNVYIGHTKYTIGGYGCFIVSLSDLCDKTPIEVNQILTDKGLIDSQGLLTDKVKIAEALGLDYLGTSNAQPPYTCIAETDNYAPSYPQHFFVKEPDGTILDPIGASVDYHVVSYRLFKNNNGGNMSDEAFKSIAWNVVNGWYNNYLWRPAAEAETKGHVDSIFSEYKGSHPEWALSNWVNRQKKEAEFKQHWIDPNTCPKGDCSAQEAIIQKVRDIVKEV